MDWTPSQAYVLRSWGAEDGLPNGMVTGITQTPNGYLWLATREGLARFDGVRFTIYTKWAGALGSTYARCVGTDRSGNLWVGLQYGGVVRLRDNRFESMLPPGLPTGITAWTSSIAEDASGSIWIGRAPEIAATRWNEGRITQFTDADGLGPGRDTYVQADVNGRIWCNTIKSVAVFDGKRFHPISLRKQVGGDTSNVRLARAARGGMWAVCESSLLHCAADGTVEEIASLDWLQISGAQEVTALFEDREGNLWMGTRANGLFRFRDGKFVQAPTSRQAVQAIAEDREGSIWVALWGGGLNRLRPQRFTLHDTRNGVPKDGVNSLVKDTENRIWLSVRDSVPTRSTSATNQSFAEVAPWPGSLSTTLYADPEGGVWIGQSGGALIRWKEGTYTPTSYAGSIASLLRDREGNVWIATEREGVFRWHDGGVSAEAITNELKRPRALAQDSAGAIWVGTEDGSVFRRENERFVPVTLPNPKPDDPIRFIVSDGEATVWIGTQSSALLRWRAGVLEQVPADAGLGSFGLRALLIDSKGGFWFARGLGLLRTTRESLASVLSGKEHVLRQVVYARNDGLPEGGFTFGRRNAVAETADGHLWFASDRGCVEVDPRRQAEDAPLLPVLIEEMRVRGQPIDLQTGHALELAPKPGIVDIQFTLPYLKAPDRLRFRYRLHGLDESWVEAENQRVASFSRLPPGRYRFEVRGRESDAPVSTETMAALSFAIRPAWWETGWFRIGAAGLGILALVALVRTVVLYRVRARMRRLEQETAVERERARIARDMHDDLGASLTQITLASQLARVAPKEEASNHIDEITAIARRTISALDEIVWMVNPRNDTLSAAIEYLGQHAIDFLSAADIACELEIPPELPSSPLSTQVRHHLFLVVKEALNNIAKHSGATSVEVKAEVDKRDLRITIADNGRGFTAGGARAGSDGLHNMHSRMAEIGGSCRLESAPGAGARIVFEIPLSPNP